MYFFLQNRHSGLYRVIIIEVVHHTNLKGWACEEVVQYLPMNIKSLIPAVIWVKREVPCGYRPYAVELIAYFFKNSRHMQSTKVKIAYIRRNEQLKVPN